MSQWSSCNAIIGIYTYKDVSDFKGLMENIMDNAPKITGSEGDCQYTLMDFVEDRSCSCNCRKCPMFNTHVKKLNILPKRLGGFNCPGLDFITDEELKKYCWPLKREVDFSGMYGRCKLIITDAHGLRDKTKEETQTEFKELLKYLRNVGCRMLQVEVIAKKII